MKWTKNEWGGWRAEGLFVGETKGKWWKVWVKSLEDRFVPRPEAFSNAEEAKKFAEGLK